MLSPPVVPVWKRQNVPILPTCGITPFFITLHLLPGRVYQVYQILPCTLLRYDITPLDITLHYVEDTLR